MNSTSGECWIMLNIKSILWSRCHAGKTALRPGDSDLTHVYCSKLPRNQLAVYVTRFDAGQTVRLAKSVEMRRGLLL